MFVQKTTAISILVAVFVFCCLTACGLSKEEYALLDKAAEQKLHKATQIFESDGLKASADYCEKEDTVTIRGGIFIIDCIVVTNLYKPEEDVIKVEGHRIILPVSPYLRIDHRSVGFLDEGYLPRNTTISAFARNEDRWFDPIITKRKDFK